jgi:hypothetical protein
MIKSYLNEYGELVVYSEETAVEAYTPGEPLEIDNLIE